MSTRDSHLETKVGIFVLLGLAVVAATVVYFGRLGQGLQEFYDVQVDFPNASGLLSGADVLLGGARIGYVSEPPSVLPAMQGVAVKLKVREDVVLPSASRFVIGSSGLLGNRFVDVIVDPGTDLAVRLEPGSVVKGERESGMEDLTRQGSELVADMRRAVATLNGTLERLDKTALGEQSLEDLRTAIANIKQGSEGLSGIGKAADDIGATAAEARRVVTSIRTGPGPLPAMINDRKSADDLRAILSNVRRHGVLWYKDTYGTRTNR